MDAFLVTSYAVLPIEMNVTLKYDQIRIFSGLKFVWMTSFKSIHNQNDVLRHPFKYATKDHGSCRIEKMSGELWMVFTCCQEKTLQVNCKPSYFQSNNSQSHTICLLNKWASDWSLKMLYSLLAILSEWSVLRYRLFYCYIRKRFVFTRSKQT